MDRNTTMSPCVEYCFLKLGQQYSPERCDSYCDYAKTMVENKKLYEQLADRDEIIFDLKKKLFNGR